MDRKDLIERFRQLDPSVWFDNPYVRARKLSHEQIQQALRQLKSNATIEQLRLLFLMDYSREVKSMAANMFSDLTDEEVAQRAEEYFEKNYLHQSADRSPSRKTSSPKRPSTQRQKTQRQKIKPIENRDRYPDAIWLDTPRLIGEVEGDALYLLGYECAQAEKPSDYPLVAIDRAGQADWFADSSGEMSKFIQAPIKLTASLD